MANRDGGDAVANRDSPIPVIALSDEPRRHANTPSPARPSRREALKEKLGNLHPSNRRHPSTGPEASPASIQDRLITMLLQQVMPATEDGESATKDRQSRKPADRPNFSLPVMSNNFRRFNARIGVVFVFQEQLIDLFTWKHPTQTLSFLAIYTFVCLDPYLLSALPLALCLFYIMIPAFLARHPPPPTNEPAQLYPLNGPPLAPPRNIKPVADLSKDFFRNMRDLQNSMEDFSRAHDAAVHALAPPTNFSNEALSSALFLLLAAATALLFLTAHLLPYRPLFLLGGWAALLAQHPRFPALAAPFHLDQRLAALEARLKSALLRFAARDIRLSAAHERRAVEIFELQRRRRRSDPSHHHHASVDVVDDAEDFEPYLFSPTPYAPLSPERVAVPGARAPAGTRFFEDVEPPPGWRWADARWTPDLASRAWVEERCITGVEVEVEGERWVTDWVEDEEEEEEAAAEEGEEGVAMEGEKATEAGFEAQRNGKGKQRAARASEDRERRGRKGEWRRRRWVRLVERKIAGESGGGG